MSKILDEPTPYVLDNQYSALQSALAHNLIRSPETHPKIRVLLVITRLTIGGDTNVVLEIAQRLNEEGLFDVQLAVGPVPEHEVDLTHLAHERGIAVKTIPSLVNYIDPLINIQGLLELRALIRAGRYDIVHTHSSVAGVVGRLAAVSARVPVIVHHVHGWGLQENMPEGMKFLYLSLEHLCARFTKRMIAVSQPTIEKGLTYHICGREKFALIYNGVRLADFRQPSDKRAVCKVLGLEPESKIVGMIGRLDAQKNPLDFIRAAALVAQRYQQVQFLIAGEGRLRGDCEQLIHDLNLDGRFFLLGFRNDIDKILPILTVVVSSSLWEGLPVVFQEAMSAGKPIVANNVDGASDVILHGETGYLVTPRRPQEMAERILGLLNHDSLCEVMGHQAREYSERFSSERMVEQIASLYKELLAGHDARNEARLT